jgi:hypothetical protein
MQSVIAATLCGRAATDNGGRVTSTQRGGYKLAFAVHRISTVCCVSFASALQRFNDSTPAIAIALKSYMQVGAGTAKLRLLS